MGSIRVWLLIGTRTWGRVFLVEACKALPLGVKIFVLIEDDGLRFRGWLEEVGLEERVATVRNLPKLDDSDIGIAIIANSAPLHFKSTREVLEAGYHALVEKPMTLSTENSLILIERAKDLGLSLFSANVFLFTEYLQKFRDLETGGTEVPAIFVTWTDPRSEKRHGSRKAYDSATPIIFDVVPHVVSLLWSLFGNQVVGKTQCVSVCEGGSRVKFRFEYGDVSVEVLLARNAQSRAREFRAVWESGSKTMDFSSEPARVWTLGGSDSTSSFLVGPPKKRPLEQVIDAVSRSVLSPNPDSRLSTSIALAGNQVIDLLVESYIHQQVSFLQDARSGVPPEKESLGYRYAIKEAESVVNRTLPLLHDSPNLEKVFQRYRDFL